MDPVTIIIAVVVVAVLVGLFGTETGRNAMRKLKNAIGASADKSADEIYKAELRQRTIEAEAAKEAQAQLAQLEKAQIYNEEVVSTFKDLEDPQPSKREILKVHSGHCGAPCCLSQHSGLFCASSRQRVRTSSAIPQASGSQRQAWREWV